MSWLFAVPIVLLCLGWVLTYARLARNLLRFPSLDDVPDEAIDRAVSVSVVMAARNEERHIEAALRSILDREDPQIELIVVDDRSTDATGAILARLAGTDRRLRPLRVDTLPDGWLGKPHALARGREAAGGRWVLFSDADVRFAPGAIRRAVALAEAKGIDHLAVFPDLHGGTFFLRVAAGTFGAHLLAGLDLGALHNPASPHCVGVGAFNLVRRAVLNRTAGFEWLRMEVADDLGLALMIKEAGGRAGAASGVGRVEVPWYADVADLIRGLEKNTFGAVGGYRLWWATASAVLMAIFAVGPFLTLLPGLPAGLPWLGAFAWLAAPACGWLGRRRFGLDVAPSFFTPIGLLVLAWAVLRSGWLGWYRGGIEWRGTFYELEDLRRGRRVTLWGHTRRV